MGWLDRWRKKKAEAVLPGTPEVKEAGPPLAFVLLEEARLPDAGEIVKAFERFRGGNEVMALPQDDGEPSDQALVLPMGGIGSLCVLLCEIPVPGGEAEHHLDYSVSSLGRDAPLAPHAAHLVVSLLPGSEEATPFARMMAFTSAIAAVTAAAGAPAVYWGNAGATHPADFFLSVAETPAAMPRAFLWNGLSRGAEDEEKVSFLSRGMGQFGLPDLYMIVPQETAGREIERFYNLLAYVAERGAPIPDEDTVGATDEERIEVRYVPSPADDGSVVWRICV